MEYLFKSERLGFRNWKGSDTKPFGEMNQDLEVMEFFPDTLSEQQSSEMIDRMKVHFENHGFTFYAVDELATNKFIGFIGLVRPKFEAFFTPCVEIGWRLGREFWNKGYATEGALMVMKHAFNALGIEELISITAVVNKKSEHIMEKIGMEFIGEFDHPKLEKGHKLERHIVYRKNRG